MANLLITCLYFIEVTNRHFKKGLLREHYNLVFSDKFIMTTILIVIVCIVGWHCEEII